MENQATEDYFPDIWYVVSRKCTPAWRMYGQELPVCNITYITEGNARYTINGINYDLSPGDLLCLPPHCTREGITYPDRLMHCFSVDFNLHNSDGKNVWLPFPIVRHVGVLEDVIRTFHELSFSWLEKHPGYIMQTRGLFLTILSHFFELIVYDVDSSAMDFRIKKITRFVAKHYKEKLTIKAMAEKVGLNAVYFGALFKKETGSSFNRYLMQIRIKNAENMLISGEYKVEEAALNCGYTDVFNFSRQFKEIKGFPPSHSLPKIGGGGGVNPKSP